MRAADIRDALAKKFCAPEYALFFEVGDATGGRARRWADAVAMGLWPSRGLSLSGFEIKVARNDWVKEMKQPAKAEAIAQYCSTWWMVTSPGIIREGELPDLWGHFELHPNGLRVIKPAPITDAAPISREFLASPVHHLFLYHLPMASETRYATPANARVRHSGTVREHPTSQIVFGGRAGGAGRSAALDTPATRRNETC